MRITSVIGINPYEDRPVEIREQVYKFCYGCNNSFLVEIRYPKGHRPVLIEPGFCCDCREDERERKCADLVVNLEDLRERK